MKTHAPIPVVGDAEHLSGASARLIGEMSQLHQSRQSWGSIEQTSLIISGLAGIVFVYCIVGAMFRLVGVPWSAAPIPCAVAVIGAITAQLAKARMLFADSRVEAIRTALNAQSPESWSHDDAPIYDPALDRREEDAADRVA